MDEGLQEAIIKQLTEEVGYIPRDQSETPPRQLSEGAEVLRVPPSPTGFVHIGTIYAGLINERIAHQSGGVFILRIEDTDKKREVEGAVNQIIDNFYNFNIQIDEGPRGIGGEYGPYLQSERGQIYLGYAVDLLRRGRAYPCFATPEELQAAVKDQQAKKVRPGYYGDWALWRDKSEADIIAALDAGKPFVLRFKSQGSHDRRVTYTDVFKGKMEVPENDLDVPLIKSDETRLPTYHLAHVVDDYLMRVTKVFRSDEWLPSTALHIELCQALGIEPFNYGHFAPISVIDKNGGKRKLSKRKDDEANVKYWVDAGYPVEAVKAYLLGLANSNFEDWFRANPGKSIDEFPVSLEKLAASRAPLLDMAKLEDYAKDYIAGLSQEEFEDGVATCLDPPEFSAALQEDPGYTHEVLKIERTGDKPRKDLAKWGDAYEQYGYFFDSLFDRDFKSRIAEELSEYTEEQTGSVLERYLSDYDYADGLDSWLAKTRKGAEYTGLHMRDYTKIIRVCLTGKSRTPDLWSIQQVMGEGRVHARLSR